MAVHLKLYSFTVVFFVSSVAYSPGFEDTKSKYQIRFVDDADLAGDDDEVSESISMLDKHGYAYQCTIPTTRLPVDGSDLPVPPFLMADLKTATTSSRDCYQFSPLGWWTYTLCPGQFVLQYHLAISDDDERPKFQEIKTLGRFQSHLDWYSIDAPHSIPRDRRTHQQFYRGGDVCDLTGKPRETTVHFWCPEQDWKPTAVSRVNEVGPCVYEVHIDYPPLCAMPYFQPYETPAEILCSSPDYNEMRRQDQLKSRAETKILSLDEVLREAQIEILEGDTWLELVNRAQQILDYGADYEFDEDDEL